MSAYDVGPTHIDALLTAGIDMAGPANPLRWYWPEITTEPGAYQAGEPWGEWSPALARERRHELTVDTADETGAMLVAQNYASVNHRYNETGEAPAYKFRRMGLDHSPVVVLQALDGYEYQACEGPTWRGSEAYTFCDALRRLCISKLPCPDRVNAWHITERDAFGPPVVSLFEMSKRSR